MLETLPFYFFRDLEYLISRVENKVDINILAVVYEPPFDAKNALDDGRFSFYGYDLIEAAGASGISAINNCGGFDRAIVGNEVSEFGLISDYDLARAIQRRLIQFYPDEIHADCDLWALWRMDNNI